MRRSDTTIKFNLGSILPGRLVKTATYTRNTRSLFNGFVTSSADQKIEDWCGKALRVTKVCLKTKRVTLQYDCPVNLFNTVEVDWPIAALSEKWGIRL